MGVEILGIKNGENEVWPFLSGNVSPTSGSPETPSFDCTVGAGTVSFHVDLLLISRMTLGKLLNLSEPHSVTYKMRK